MIYHFGAANHRLAGAESEYMLLPSKMGIRMHRIAFVLLGVITALAGCQSGPSGANPGLGCTPRLEEAGRCSSSYGTTYTLQQN
jgi:hypothetical protein